MIAPSKCPDPLCDRADGTCVDCIVEEINRLQHSAVILVSPKGTMTLIKEEDGHWRAVESEEDE